MIERALELLPVYAVRVRKCSTIIESEPAGGPPQDPYLNAVVAVETDLSPQELLSTVKKIEKLIGRTPTVVNGPRVIDLDILLYNDKVVQEHNLTIPHPRMFERSFVTGPLEEIAPGLVEKWQIWHKSRQSPD